MSGRCRARAGSRLRHCRVASAGDGVTSNSASKPVIRSGRSTQRAEATIRNVIFRRRHSRRVARSWVSPAPDKNRTPLRSTTSGPGGTVAIRPARSASATIGSVAMSISPVTRTTTAAPDRFRVASTPGVTTGSTGRPARDGTADSRRDHGCGTAAGTWSSLRSSRGSPTTGVRGSAKPMVAQNEPKNRRRGHRSRAAQGTSPVRVSRPAVRSGRRRGARCRNRRRRTETSVSPVGQTAQEQTTLGTYSSRSPVHPNQEVVGGGWRPTARDTAHACWGWQRCFGPDGAAGRTLTAEPPPVRRRGA